MEIFRVKGNYVQGVVEPANIVNPKDRVTVNWSAIGSVGVGDAEKFAFDVLRVCKEIREYADSKGIKV